MGELPGDRLWLKRWVRFCVTSPRSPDELSLMLMFAGSG